ncbi:MAG: homoserine O-acetyltransferase [Cyclobacteriaceae bacterium]|nr:homoserine O-acetyltransferase [Cyclobacteriaceae bacterium]
MSIDKYYYKEYFQLESGEVLPELKIVYQTFGTLNSEKSNVVWVFHALTANADVLDWWPGLFGENELFNPDEHFIICSNVIGSPYGSIVPTNLDFPFFTVRDVVNAQVLLANELQINRIHVAIGGSFGGSQALEFAHSFQGDIEHLILIASAAKESAWGIAIHEAQRLAIQADSTFGQKDGGREGIKAARAIGMLTYRTSEAYNVQQTDEDDRTDEFKAASYIRYQGEKLAKRFNALAYYYLTKCLDSHNVGRGRGGVAQALKKITSKTLVVGINTDQLLPTKMQKQLVQYLSNAQYEEIESDYGHDGFLLEVKQLSKCIKGFINN